MRKKILAFVFGAALLMALALPLVGGASTSYAIMDPNVPADNCSGNSVGGAAIGKVNLKGNRTIPGIHDTDSHVPSACPAPE